MKKLFYIIVVLVLLAGWASPAAAQDGQNLVSLSVGGFHPNEDFNLAGFNNGPDFTLGYVRTIGDYFGAGMELNSYTSDTDTNSSGDDYKFISVGLEFLGYLQPNGERFQPYLALGFGAYDNEFKAKHNGFTAWESTGTGFGVLAKAGFRAFITDVFYLGAFAKFFTNEQDVNTPYGEDTAQMGGATVNIEGGFRF
ncbi:MAG: outer membrane beta-barrel protein [Smithellaceae bacterium]|nr:outer membrane beta-barrel protein [Smithellaceae bacterium]